MQATDFAGGMGRVEAITGTRVLMLQPICPVLCLLRTVLHGTKEPSTATIYVTPVRVISCGWFVKGSSRQSVRMITLLVHPWSRSA